MRLRELKKKDATRMLEWMHDSFVVEKLQTDFDSKTIEDCMVFINSSSNDSENLHLAIVDEADKYMGTVSLKHITNQTAEFAITVHRDAMGKGYAVWAMNEITSIGFEKFKLKYIYWCVAPDNKRALRFYDKNGFLRVDSRNINIAGEYTQNQINSYIWYKIVATETN